MRIPEAEWAELQAGLDVVETFAALAGILRVSEKTAKEWITDRERMVRPHKFAGAMKRLRDWQLARKTEAQSPKGVQTDTKPLALASTDADPSAKPATYPDEVLASPSRDTINAEGWRMVLNDDEAAVILAWRRKGISKAREELDDIAGSGTKARGGLQRGRPNTPGTRKRR